MPAEQASSSTSLRIFSVVLTVLIVILAFAAGYFLRGGDPPPPVAERAQQSIAAAWPTTPATFTPIPTATAFGPAPTATPLPLPDWTELGNLTSIRFNSSTIVTQERAQLLGSDKVIVMVAADVLMGIDLTKVQARDVRMEGRKLYLTLPRASITGVELRLNDSQIYDAQSAWLGSDYQGLETSAIEQAQRQIYDYSVNNQSMIELTEMMARLQLSDFLRKTGFEDVEIKFAGPPNSDDS